jgi:transcriptional regulator with XRE-family HTH domain|uniref:Helix-turn-helix XRE-family like protein n=2 Tax=unclassified Caudoviricetes TaxID=2788787 RepID=A0A8S5U8A0_9CAUD|nr:MAG TPA: Helix-turn-helix XRE-family like protein [Siphoviridae sp. ct9j27]DAG04317.1 MAG TPA: Helix-turn-helix XRE-family like protein [Siphoviridae sp. ctYkG6]DAJ19099.1 MAG TPA: Helix-turn-helix XRE-family like protein [Siphoviridae sp. cty4Z2]DAQ31608.1 MAG TPA: Helix-turn-helix XRE-family like protein [Caudoviricetes sp.]DAS50013.1 MAG TPA: Helix-turn-helix XRE-family like protein [Caudoviricetes sp.]
MDQMDSIAVRIRIAMARENVSARELATRTNLSESTIYKASKEENDEKTSLKTIRLLADALNVSAKWLACLE